MVILFTFVNQLICIMKERLLEFLRAENKSSAQLAEEIGVQPSGISHILSGRNNPSLDFVLKMLEKYQFVSTDWLLFGKGSMYKETNMQSLFDKNSDINPSTQKILTTVDERNQGNMLQQDDIVLDTITSSKSERNTALKAKKIVWFYNNNTFEEFHPG
jgi:transcriptional regulator with XRE-family HTH domain